MILSGGGYRSSTERILELEMDGLELLAMGLSVPLDRTLDGPVLFAEKDPELTNEPIVGVEGSLLKIFSSSTSFFHATNPPTSNMGGRFSGLWNSFSNIARKSADMGESTGPKEVDSSS
jgi:hypothetical protein